MCFMNSLPTLHPTSLDGDRVVAARERAELTTLGLSVNSSVCTIVSRKVSTDTAWICDKQGCNSPDGAQGRLAG